MRRSGPFLTSAAIAALVASFLPLCARLGWTFELAAHFRVQYVVVDTLLAIVLATQRRFALTAVLAAGAVLSATPVLPYLPSALETADAAARPPLKLLVANVFYRNSSVAGLLRTIRRESPDVVLILEYTPAWAERLGELRGGYPYRVESPQTNAYGIALFSRVELATAEPFMLDDTPGIEARLRVREAEVTLLGVHLHSPTSPRRAALRNRQLGLLAERENAVRGTVIVSGDFNISPYSPYYGDWLERTGLTDTRRGRTFSPSWPTYFPLAAIPIDHFFVSSDVAVVAQRRLPAFGSDHYPVLVELALPPRPTEGSAQ